MFRGMLAAAAIAVAPVAAQAAVILTDGNVSLGVDDYGQLNVYGGVPDVVSQTAVGVRWIDPATGTQYESTSHGCLCEGWGLAVDGVSGSANNDYGGASGLTLESFSFVGTTSATSVVKIVGTDVKVTHSFALSTATDDLFEVKVKIENTGATDVASLEYRRTMDWDASPTPFQEYVTIGGVATTTLLKESSDNGFSSGDPLSLDVFDLAGCGITTDFTACGPSDHGALFDFDLGGLLAGESYEFSIFYGGAANKAAANTALGAVGAELFSFGWSYTDADQNGLHDDTGAVVPTFIFAFAGVGGEVIIPPDENGGPNPIPLPGAAWLLLGGFGSLAGLRARRRHG